MRGGEGVTHRGVRTVFGHRNHTSNLKVHNKDFLYSVAIVYIISPSLLSQFFPAASPMFCAFFDFLLSALHLKSQIFFLLSKVYIRSITNKILRSVLIIRRIPLAFSQLRSNCLTDHAITLQHPERHTLKMAPVTINDIPKLTIDALTSYPAWKAAIEVTFLILDLSSTISFTHRAAT